MKETEQRYADYTQMVGNLAKPGQAILDSLTPEKCHLLHMAFGLQGETLESMTVDGTTQESFIKGVTEEVGDVLFYYVGLMSINPEWDLMQFTLDAFDRLEKGELPERSLVDSVERLCSMVKKYTMYQKDISIEEFEPYFKEVMFSIAHTSLGLQAQVGITFKDIMEGNVNKLLKGKNARYASGKYSDDQAVNRADKPEGEDL